jgi:hypothetical protein
MFIQAPVSTGYHLPMRSLFLLLLLSPMLPLQASERPPGSPSHREMRVLKWQEQISEPDRKRLAGLWSAWTRALNQAADAGEGARLADLGALAVADAAKPGPFPAEGTFNCRSIGIGIREPERPPKVPALDIAEPQSCTITARNGLFWLEQTGGPARIAGTLYPDEDRMVFLGTKALRGEMGMRRYGSDATRDQVGVLRALGPGHWRLELPWPHWQSNLELVEIRASGSPPPGGAG